jgi:hypothetical protein
MRLGEPVARRTILRNQLGQLSPAAAGAPAHVASALVVVGADITSGRAHQRQIPRQCNRAANAVANGAVARGEPGLPRPDTAVSRAHLDGAALLASVQKIQPRANRVSAPGPSRTCLAKSSEWVDCQRFSA